MVPMPDKQQPHPGGCSCASETSTWLSHLHVGKAPLPDALDELQLLLRQLDLGVVVLIIDDGQLEVIALQQGVQLVPTLALEQPGALTGIPAGGASMWMLLGSLCSGL